MLIKGRSILTFCLPKKTAAACTTTPRMVLNKSGCRGDTVVCSKILPPCWLASSALATRRSSFESSLWFTINLSNVSRAWRKKDNINSMNITLMCTYITTNPFSRISTSPTKSGLLVECQQEKDHLLWIQVLHCIHV